MSINRCAPRRPLDSRTWRERPQVLFTVHHICPEMGIETVRQVHTLALWDRRDLPAGCDLLRHFRSYGHRGLAHVIGEDGCQGEDRYMAQEWERIVT